jgi:regulation of enolase protein 1 (concanavalin A-like superfamily)
MHETVAVPGLPFALTASQDSQWRVDPAEGVVAITAAPHSDIFIDPSGASGDDQVNAENLMNAVTLLGEPPEGDFQFSARVGVIHNATFDAGVLLLWVDAAHWAKLCFEFSPDREPMVVSVVTRTVSDDANAFVVEADHIWLRISRIGQVWAFHASHDGNRWHLVRAFALEAPQADRAGVRIGFEAQSPVGDGCDVEFSRVTFIAERLSDLRDGS